MTAYARALATIDRQKGEIERLRTLVHALRHFIGADFDVLREARRQERNRARNRRRMAQKRRDEANRKRFERTFDALGRTA